VITGSVRIRPDMAAFGTEAAIMAGGWAGSHRSVIVGAVNPCDL